MDAIPPMSEKPRTDIEPRGLQSIKMDSPVGQHVSECCVTLRACDWRIKDQCNVQKIKTIEAIHIVKEAIAEHAR